MWRLSDPKVFSALAGTRQRLRTGPLTVSWVPGAPSEPPRVAYAIGKRVGGAVVRNRLRRRLRALVAACAPPPGAYLVSASPAAVEAPTPELRAALARAFADIRVRQMSPS